MPCERRSRDLSPHAGMRGPGKANHSEGGKMQEGSVTASAVGESAPLASARQTAEPMRRRLPGERKGIIHHFSVGGHEGYLIVGLYEDGQPGEIFIRMAKAGSTIAGLTDSFGIAVSLALQYRVPLGVLCSKFSHTRFEPSGWSGVKEIGYAKSIMDYIARWLAWKFLPPTSPTPPGVGAEVTAPAPAHLGVDGVSEAERDAPVVGAALGERS